MNENNNPRFEGDYLFLEGMEVPCMVGITPEERAFPQILNISIRLCLSLRRAGRSDDLSQSIDYARVLSEIKKILHHRKFKLVETVAEVIASHLLKEKKITGAEIKVEKKVFAGVKSIGVMIRREQIR
jgi:FolB domain-containing protein